jgi:hypothetical protein
MRLSRKAKENMIMYGNHNPPAKPLSNAERETERKARNKRKAAAKVPVVIIPLPGRTDNPKKNPRARRARVKLATYIPFVLRHPRYMKHPLTGKRTVFAGYRGFNNTNEAQKVINDALIMRAHQAREDGGYLHINPRAGHGKSER